MTDAEVQRDWLLDDPRADANEFRKIREKFKDGPFKINRIEGSKVMIDDDGREYFQGYQFRGVNKWIFIKTANGIQPWQCGNASTLLPIRIYVEDLKVYSLNRPFLPITKRGPES